MARLHDVVFDCAHPASLARFWAAVLEGYEVEPYDEAELTRLRSLGIDDPEDDPTVLVVGPSPPRYFFQKVPEGKVVKNRVHVDLDAGPASFDAELLCLRELGAAVLDDDPDRSFVVLADPEGNEFCLMR